VTSLPARSRDESTRGYLMVAGGASLWGTWSLFLRPAEQAAPFPPALETLLMFGTVAALALPFAWRELPRVQRSGRDWLLMIALGCADAINVLFFFWAMQRSSVAIGVLSHYLAPLLVAASAPAVLGEPARPSTLAAVALGLTGLALLMNPWSSAGDGAWVGGLLGATSAAFYALTTLLNKRLERVFAPRQLLAFHAVPAVVVLALFVPPGTWGLAGSRGALWIVAGGALLSAFGGLVYLQGLAHVPASRASILTLLEPMVAVVVASVVWREVPSPLAGLGALFILSAAYLVLRIDPPAPPDVPLPPR
jgi:drug/metabolite transporter (DMT)-like permease